MKILFDISVLGIGVKKKLYRTGISRVNENILHSLQGKMKDDLHFYASSQDTYIDFLENKKQAFGFHNLFVQNRILDRMLINLNKKAISLKKKTDERIKHFSKQGEAIPHYFHRILNMIIRAICKLFIIFSDNGINKRYFFENNIYHSFFYKTLPVFLRRIGGIKHIYTIYDLIPILMPDYFCEENGRHPLKVMLDTYITETDYFMCISECTKRDLLTYSKKILSDHCFVIPLAAGSNFKPCKSIDQITGIKEKYSIPRGCQYILSVCTLEPRKNLRHLVRSFLILIQSEHIDDLVLVLTGAKGWLIDDLFEEVRNNDLLNKKIILTGYVDDEELSPLYSGALVFVYPSLYEGFGLPPLEAMQCGTPVICSNTSSLPEVVGDAGILVDPHDQDILVKSLRMLYNDKEKREHYSKLAIERAKCFSWEKTGAMVYDMYRKVLGRSLSD